MKKCTHCGRENEDAATRCHECGGTEFQIEQAAAPAEGSRVLDFEPFKAEESNHTWVTLVRCPNVVEADMIAMELRAAEIPVFIPDEFLMQAISFNTNSYGFVRVQVPPTQYEAAREFLVGKTTPAAGAE